MNSKINKIHHMMIKIQINLIKMAPLAIQMMNRQMMRMINQSLRLRLIHKIMPSGACSLERGGEPK